MVHKSAGTFVNGRKQTLRTVEYLPDQQSRPKALLFFHHGYGEHISRYERGTCRIQLHHTLGRNVQENTLQRLVLLLAAWLHLTA